MILSIHLADVGLAAAPGILRCKPDPSEVKGLLYAETTITAPLSRKVLPTPRLGRVGLIAAWDDDAAVDEFSANDRLAEQLSGGWHVRLAPLQAFGAWSAIPGRPTEELPAGDEESVAVPTLGRLRFRRLNPFLRTSARAEAEALADPALLAVTALGGPPVVATFSLWRTAVAMRDYAYRRSGGAHPAAMRANSAKPFHSESAFVRFRPYASQGSWGGYDPLAATTAPAT